MAEPETEETPKIAPNKLFKEQFDDEEVLLVFHKHPVVMRKGLVLASLGILLPVLYVGVLTIIFKNTPDRIPSVGEFFGSVGLGFFLGFLLFLPSWISWHFSVYIVTDQRMIQITQKGLFHRSQVALGLSQIQMVNYEIAGLQETLLGFGTIVIQTYVGSLTIQEVHHPAEIQKQLLEILKEQGINVSQSPMSAENQEATEEA